MSGQKFQDLYIQIGDVKTRYWDVGNNGSPIILIHGLGSFIEHWKHNIEHLSRHHRVLVLDLVGFGLTEKPTVPYSIPYLAEFVQEFIAAKGIDKISVIGNSMGAMIAIELYFINPKIVDKLVLIGGGTFGRKLAFALRLLTLPFIGESLMRPKREGTQQFFNLLFANQNLVTDEMIDLAFARNSQSGSAQAYLATLRSAANVFGLKRKTVKRTVSNANQVLAPTLLVWGKKDNMLPIEQAYKAMKMLPNADLLTLEDCGHMPQIECYEDVNEKVLAFLNTH